jgi:hypothetical protein
MWRSFQCRPGRDQSMGTGPHRPSPYYIRLLCLALDACPEELGFLPRPALVHHTAIERIVLRVPTGLYARVREAAELAGLLPRDWWILMAERALSPSPAPWLSRVDHMMGGERPSLPGQDPSGSWHEDDTERTAKSGT